MTHTFTDGLTTHHAPGPLALADRIEDEARRAIHEAEQRALEADVDRVLAQIRAELLRAKWKHPKPFNSPHEGYAVILEEMDELFEEVRADNIPRQREEAVQVGAMAARYLLEI